MTNFLGMGIFWIGLNRADLSCWRLTLRGMGFSVRLLSAKKHESGRNYVLPPSPGSNRIIIYELGQTCDHKIIVPICP